MSKCGSDNDHTILKSERDKTHIHTWTHTKLLKAKFSSNFNFSEIQMEIRKNHWCQPSHFSLRRFNKQIFTVYAFQWHAGTLIYQLDTFMLD